MLFDTGTVEYSSEDPQTLIMGRNVIEFWSFHDFFELFFELYIIFIDSK